MDYYVHLNENDVVIGIYQLKDEVNNTSYVKILEYDVTLLGKKFNKETGLFEDFIQITETPSPTLEDKVNYLYYKQRGLI